MRKLLLLLVIGLSTALAALGQCSSGTTQAKLNWDNLDFLVPDASNYVTALQAQTQNFAFGTNKLTITHNYTTVNAPGENATNTGEVGTYGAGDDVEFTGDGTITVSFQTAVQNLKFSLYDIDYGQNIVITALNGAVAQSITVTKLSGTQLTVAGSGTTSVSATAVSGKTTITDVADNSTDGTINVDIAGPVTSFKIMVTASSGKGQEKGSFWLSDIEACISSGTFPLNYQQTGSNQPFTGQPDYFITTPDNNSAYMVDPATGRAWYLFTEASAKYINSFAYDPYNKVFYYVVDGSATPSANKKVRKYDFNTETASDFIPDITTYGIPTFDGGVESASASFYDGALYLGIEGGTGRESIVWRININNGTPSQAYQVFGVSANGHDWGDFIIKNGILVDFNTSQNGNSQFKHLNLMNGTLVNYPTASAGQAGMSWTGSLYSVRNTVEKYNEDGTLGTPQTITVVSGPAWVGNAGDASGPFKPKADFGDAPASYDPIVLSPAVHEMDSTLKIGATIDREWEKAGSTNADADGGDEDGLLTGRIMNLSNGKYLAQVNIYNHTGVDATVGAWVDFDKNGTFDPGEGVTKTVPSSTSMQTVDLYWTGIATDLASNSYTYLRVRTTSASNLMTVNNPTGYYGNGEVEDHYIVVNTTTLDVKDVKLETTKKNGKVQVKWTLSGDEKDVVHYYVQRSATGNDWNQIGAIDPGGNSSYILFDQQPLQGISYYRIEILLRNGHSLYSEVKKVVFDGEGVRLSVLSNPAVSVIRVAVQAYETQKASLYLLDNYGSRIISLSRTIHKGINEINMPVDRLPAGQYYLQIETERYTDQKKVVIVK